MVLPSGEGAAEVFSGDMPSSRKAPARMWRGPSLNELYVEILRGFVISRVGRHSNNHLRPSDAFGGAHVIPRGLDSRKNGLGSSRCHGSAHLRISLRAPCIQGGNHGSAGNFFPPFLFRYLFGKKNIYILFFFPPLPPQGKKKEEKCLGLFWPGDLGRGTTAPKQFSLSQFDSLSSTAMSNSNYSTKSRKRSSRDHQDFKLVATVLEGDGCRLLNLVAIA